MSHSFRFCHSRFVIRTMFLFINPLRKYFRAFYNYFSLERRRCRLSFNEIFHIFWKGKMQNVYVAATYWVEDQTDKDDLIARFRENTKQKQCKYVKEGYIDDCPFGNKCFYKHELPDGTIVEGDSPRTLQRFSYTKLLSFIVSIYFYGNMMMYDVLQTKTPIIFRNMVIFWFRLWRWFFENYAGHYQPSIQSCLESFWNIFITPCIVLIFCSTEDYYFSVPINRKSEVVKFKKRLSFVMKFLLASFCSYLMVNQHHPVSSYWLSTWVCFFY